MKTKETACKYCGKMIQFLMSVNKKWIPCELDGIDPQDIESFPTTLVFPDGSVVTFKSAEDTESYEEVGYEAHFANCVNYQRVDKRICQGKDPHGTDETELDGN